MLLVKVAFFLLLLLRLLPICCVVLQSASTRVLILHERGHLRALHPVQIQSELIELNSFLLFRNDLVVV